MGKVLALLLILPAAGCSWSHEFELADVEKIRLGETTFEEAKRVLKCDERYTGHFYSSEQAVVPPAPLSWVSWPVFLSRKTRSYSLDLFMDARGVVYTASLQVAGTNCAGFLLLLSGGSDLVALSEDDVESLRRLQREGVEVRVGVQPIRCFGGILGWETMALDDYLGLGD